MKPNKGSQSGFTLIEMIIVMVIIGVSSTFVIGLINNMMASWQMGLAVSQLQASSSLAQSVMPASLYGVDKGSLVINGDVMTSGISNQTKEYPISLSDTVDNRVMTMSRVTSPVMNGITELEIACSNAMEVSYNTAKSKHNFTGNCNFELDLSAEIGRPDWLSVSTEYTYEGYSLYYLGGSDVY